MLGMTAPDFGNFRQVSDSVRVQELTCELNHARCKIQMLERDIEFLKFIKHTKPHYKYNWKLGKAERVV